jgi:hypothetical protein
VKSLLTQPVFRKLAAILVISYGIYSILIAYS